MKKRIKASFSIEAAFVVPLIIFGIVGLIWVIFHLYDSVKLSADLDKAVFKMENEYAEVRKPQGYSDLSFKSEIEGYFGGAVKEALAERNGRSITATVSVSMNLPESGILGIIVSGIRSLKGVREITIPNRTEITRIIKAASDLVEVIMPKVQKKD